MYITHKLRNESKRKKINQRISNILCKTKVSHYRFDSQISEEMAEENIKSFMIPNSASSNKNILPNVQANKKKISKFVPDEQSEKSETKILPFIDFHQTIYKISEKEKPHDLGLQSYKKLSNFIKGAYHNDEDDYSNNVDIEGIEQTRKNFKTFNKVYERMMTLNTERKISIKDIESQNFRGIVFLNENKDKINKSHLKFSK